MLFTGPFYLRGRHAGLPAVCVSPAFEACGCHKISALVVLHFDTGLPRLPYVVPPSRFWKSAASGLSGAAVPVQRGSQHGG